MSKTHGLTTEEFLASIDRESKGWRGVLWRIRLFPRRVWETPGNVRRAIRFFIQRGRRGYSERDVWSFDYYLSRIIPEGLRLLAKWNTGTPQSFIDKYGDECGNEEWLRWLERVAAAFDEWRMLTEGHLEIDTREWLARQEAARATMRELFDHFESLWD